MIIYDYIIIYTFYVFLHLYIIIPATTSGPPPCILRALTVATITAQLGTNPDLRHLILKNFSIPIPVI